MLTRSGTSARAQTDGIGQSSWIIRQHFLMTCSERFKTSVHVVAFIAHQKISILWAGLTLLTELTLRSWKLVTLKCAVSDSTHSIPPNPNECIASSMCPPEMCSSRKLLDRHVDQARGRCLQLEPSGSQIPESLCLYMPYRKLSTNMQQAAFGPLLLILSVSLLVSLQDLALTGGLRNEELGQGTNPLTKVADNGPSVQVKEVLHDGAHKTLRHVLGRVLHDSLGQF